ncbi:MAG: hypothetical protein NTW99_00575 [Chloroflexi bacterium]|nr:hypothetical protein [Chloroflexota bacterium]
MDWWTISTEGNSKLLAWCELPREPYRHFHATGRRIRHLPANLERVLLGHDLLNEGSDLACKFDLHATR